jgi:hypothetical protein
LAITVAPTIAATSPFWHRSEPVTATVRLDPDYLSLRREFPTSWQHLVRAKLCLDCVATVDLPRVDSETAHQRRTVQLVREAAEHLDAFSRAEARYGDVSVARDGWRVVDTLSGFAETGQWPAYVTPPPEDGGRWLYCGPLGTWADNDVRTPLSLLVVAHDTKLQRVVDHVSASRATLVAEVTEVLGAVADDEQKNPGMFTTTLLLAGGHSAIGHKNFAHFLPLESPGGSVEGEDFTVVFANVHRERIARCSLPLLENELGKPVNCGVDDVLAASLLWFRCHDLGHFWRRPDALPRTTPSAQLDSFGLMAIEETYADLLGLICAAELGDRKTLVVAFVAELMRYLSRDQGSFADSVAAAIEAGWLTNRTGDWRPFDENWCDTAVSEFRELVSRLHDVLWGGTPVDTIPELVAAADTGRREAARRSSLFRRIPTDLIYTSG